VRAWYFGTAMPLQPVYHRGWAQLLKLLRGHFHGINETKILECLTRLGIDIQIIVTPHVDSTPIQGEIQIVFA